MLERRLEPRCARCGGPKELRITPGRPWPGGQPYCRGCHGAINRAWIAKHRRSRQGGHGDARPRKVRVIVEGAV